MTESNFGKWNLQITIVAITSMSF